MKPQLLHTQGNIIVQQVGKVAGNIVILHEGEVSSPEPEHLSPCYAPVQRTEEKKKKEEKEEMWSPFLYETGETLGLKRFSDVAVKIIQRRDQR